MKIIKIALTALLLLGSIHSGIQAHSIAAALAACDTIRGNRMNHVDRDLVIREDRATDQMLGDLAGIEVQRDAEELAAWNTYNVTMAGIFTEYYIEEALCYAAGGATGAATAICITMAELHALNASTQAYFTYLNAMAVAAYHYNTAYNQIITTWQDALEDADNLYDIAVSLVNLLHDQCVNSAYTHLH